MPAIPTTFSDLDLNFVPHPVSGDLIPLKNDVAVKRAVRNLIFTDIYERPFQPRLGSGLRQLLFEPINPLTKKGIEDAVRSVLTQFEKRVRILEIVANVKPDENGYDVSITFSIEQLSTISSVDIFLERIR